MSWVGRALWVWWVTTLMYRGGDSIGGDVEDGAIMLKGVIATDVNRWCVHHGGLRWVRKVEAPMGKEAWAGVVDLFGPYTSRVVNFPVSFV